MAVTEVHPLHPTVPLETVHPHAEAQIHPVIPVDLGAYRADLGTQHTAQRYRQGLDHGDLQSPAPGGGRHLGTDEPGTHHHHPPGSGLQLCPYRQAVVQAPQGVDTVQAAGGQLTAAGPGGDEDTVGGNRRTAVEGDGAGGHVEPDSPVTQPPPDIQIPERGTVGQEDAIRLPLPGQNLLGQGRPIVGLVGLITNDGDGSVEPVSPQRFGRPGTGQRRSDDGDGAQRLLLLGDGDGLLGAALDCLVDPLAGIIARGLVQQVQEVVVTHLENVRSNLHANGVALTQVVVHDHPVSHWFLPSPRRHPRPYPTSTHPATIEPPNRWWSPRHPRTARHPAGGHPYGEQRCWV